MNMKTMLRLALGFITVGLLAFAVGPAQAATSNGPYYAEPSWDQKLDAATRFVVLLNWNSDAVLDRETGLVWERSPATTTYNWSIARSLCIDRTVGGRKGWRLPSINELASLTDPSVASPGPAMPAGHPFTNVQSGGYWSTTTLAGFATYAWFVNFFDRGVVLAFDKADALFVWCVRGGGVLDTN
jgi:hypothetical protein